MSRFGSFAITLSLVMLACVFFHSAPAFAWLEGWSYRKPITITEQSGQDLTDYQVLIELNSSNFDFSKANSNGSDIRFTDESDNLLSYWMEEWDSTGETAKIWVKVPEIPASSSVTIYMYYGNPSATSESDGNAVFEFFDDASTDRSSEYSVTSDTGSPTWTYYSSGYYELFGAAGGSQATVHHNTFTFTNGRVIEEIQTDNDVGVGFRKQDQNNLYLIAFTSSEHLSFPNKVDVWKRVSGTWTKLRSGTSGEIDNQEGVWHTVEYAVKGTEIKYFKFDGNIVFSGVSLGTDFSSGYLIVARTEGAFYMKVRKILVTKYTDPEPSYSLDSEETQTLAGITVHIFHPSDNQIFNVTTVDVNYTVIPNNVPVESCSYMLDNSTNITLPNCENFTLTNLTEGIHNLTIWAWNSTEGVYSKDSVSFKIDLTPPLITFLSPADEETSREVQVSFIAEDNVTSVVACGYKIDNGNWSNLPGCMNFSYTFSGAGWHTIWINATDEVGYTGVASKSVLINPIQSVRFRDATSGEIVQNVTLYIWNSTFTLARSTSSGEIQWKLFEGPLGTVYLKPYAVGYNASVFEANLTVYSDLNQTFELPRASLTITVYDESDPGFALPFKVIISNETASQTFTGEGWNLYDDFTGSGTYPDSNKWVVERCDGFSSGYCVRLASNKLLVKYSYAGDGECDWSATYSKSSSSRWEFDISGCSVTGQGYGGIYLRDDSGNVKQLYQNCKNGHWKIYVRDNVAYVFVDGVLEASVDVSTLSSYHIRFLSGQCRNSSGATTKATYFYVDNLNREGSFYKLWNEIPTGSLTITVSPSPETEFYMTDYVTRTYYSYIDQFSTISLNAYLLRSSQALTQSFLIQSSRGTPVDGALITIRRKYGNSWVTVAQAKTDSSGYAHIPLDPTVTYQIHVSAPGYSSVTGTLIPSPNLKTITLLESAGAEETGMLGITYSLAILNLTRNSNATVKFSINCEKNDLEYFFLNITNSTFGKVFYQKVAGSPSGGSIEAYFPVTDKKYNIIYGFKRSGFNEYAWLREALVGIKSEAVNGTLKQLLERSEMSPFSKVILSAIFVILATMVHPFFGLLALWFLGITGWIPIWVPILTSLAALLVMGG